jgi:hypothetical protein
MAAVAVVRERLYVCMLLAQGWADGRRLLCVRLITDKHPAIQPARMCCLPRTERTACCAQVHTHASRPRARLRPDLFPAAQASKSQRASRSALTAAHAALLPTPAPHWSQPPLACNQRSRGTSSREQAGLRTMSAPAPPPPLTHHARSPCRQQSCIYVSSIHRTRAAGARCAHTSHLPCLPARVRACVVLRCRRTIAALTALTI